MMRSRYPTLLDLIRTVSEVAASDQETLATVADLINSGQVRLCGASAGATIDLSATDDMAAWGPRSESCAWVAMLVPPGAHQEAEAAGVPGHRGLGGSSPMLVEYATP
jgi:hypothetical protein